MDAVGGSTPQRVGAIDALRGFALVGILLINITTMGGPIRMEDPQGPAALADPDWQVWFFSQVFVFGSMRGLFSILFGISALLFLSSPERSPSHFARRCFWLLCFGVINSTLLLWPGDILLIYALASPAILLLLRASTRQLFIAALVMLGVLSVWSYFRVAGAAGGEETAQAALDLAEERAARMGDYWSNLQFMLRVAVEWTFTPGLLWWIADAASFMLIGMAVFKTGMVKGTAPFWVYFALMAVGFGLGAPLRIWQASLALANEGEFPPFAAATWQLGRLLVTVGWIGAFMLLWRTLPRPVFAPLSALGKMAFTGYLLQSVAAAVLFSGFGFGLWNRLSWVELWALVPIIMGVMALAFMLWLNWFQMGPLEWIWRRLTFGGSPMLLRSRPIAD